MTSSLLDWISRSTETKIETKTTKIHKQFNYLTVDEKTYAIMINHTIIHGLLSELYAKSYMLVLLNLDDVEYSSSPYTSSDLLIDDLKKLVIEKYTDLYAKHSALRVHTSFALINDLQSKN